MLTIMNPDYDLFVQIVFMWWVLQMFIDLMSGLLQIEISYPKKAGIIEITSGIIGMIVITVCLI